MKHKVFEEIEKFEKWFKLSDLKEDNKEGAWDHYPDWRNIDPLFENFIFQTDPNTWTDEEKRILLHIISLDNECMRLVKTLSNCEHALTTLMEASIAYGSPNDKWQLALCLHKLSDKTLALQLLEKLVNDEDEYVNRRSLMEMAKLKGPMTEYYCEKFWHKNKYEAMEEYQRMAVLHALREVHSKLLPTYIELAKQDGREHLVLNARNIEKEL
jgi:hypothetical protein